jgi:hypothetical protein
MEVVRITEQCYGNVQVQCSANYRLTENKPFKTLIIVIITIKVFITS